MNQDYELYFANNGIEAIQHYNKDIFDCILMDIAMPEMDGITATQSIRKIEKKLNKHTPIIAVTASDPDSNREIYIKAGLDEIIAKPVNMDELVNKIITHSNIRFD